MLGWLAHQFGEALRVVLEGIDTRIARERDSRRYRLKGKETRELQTLLGVTVTFRRRRYYDRLEQRGVYLFDEAMGLATHQQVSPALATWTLAQAVWKLFGTDRRVLGELAKARRSDVTGATFLSKLAEAVSKLRDPEKRRMGEALLNDLADIPEAVVDYRLRLEAMGISTAGLRGMGTAESQVDTFSDRVKQRGRSWSRKGLAAMMELMCWRNTNTLHHVMAEVENLLIRSEAPLQQIREQVLQRARQVVEEGLSVFQAGVPITRSGRTASRGLSWWMNRLISGTAG